MTRAAVAPQPLAHPLQLIAARLTGHHHHEDDGYLMLIG
jgi:hypothetical protein